MAVKLSIKVIYNMTRNQRKYLQQGSAHIWIIVALILIIIGLLGYVFWKQLSDTDNKSDTSTGKVQSSNSTNDTSDSNSENLKTLDSISYIRSLQYPSQWSSYSGEEVCSKFNLCASGPSVLLADEDKNIKFTFSGPQSGSDVAIDDQASSVADDYDGEVKTDLKSIDGIEARKVKKSDGGTIIPVLLSKGYGYIEFGSTVTDDEMNTVLSTLKWF